MLKRVTFSGDNQLISQIALHHRDLEDALRQYFSLESGTIPGRYVGYTRSELAAELQRRLAEIELTSSMAVLAAFEASLRVDYLKRCYEKRKDPLSRDFREVYAQRGSRAGLEDEILAAWCRALPRSKPLIDNLIAAFKFRHWLAHGRYWTPKWGAKPIDFQEVYMLVDWAGRQFDLKV
ncbi:hypothetical protein [Peteryoungia ipomoeae]|uniref:Uncharacterized protein n=1 Tax=Peteryoungia ipomoeae TaxID=1210932 RepID=A0A4S8NXB1_9HYPH|nr:hypothetical protein [Peteryoungia ipomoeae]THV21561.1 hypothetical protein FAA97_16250 [Peteryoungia ipomoeae]